MWQYWQLRRALKIHNKKKERQPLTEKDVSLFFLFMAGSGWEIIARPPSQNIKNGSTACSGVATVFCLSANPDNVLATDFKSIIKIGVSLWVKWYKKVGKQQDSSYSSVEELIENLEQVRELIDSRDFEYRIFSGFVVKDACASEEAFYLRDALMQKIKPGMCAVLSQDRVKNSDGDVLKAPHTISVCRSTEGLYYVFDSHASVDSDKGKLIRFESAESLWQWCLTTDGLYVKMLEEAYEKLTPAQREDYADTLTQFYYRLTVFNKKQPSPGPTAHAADSASIVAAASAVVTPAELEPADDDVVPVPYCSPEPANGSRNARPAAVPVEACADADDVFVVGTSRSYIPHGGGGRTSAAALPDARRDWAEDKRPVLRFTLNYIGAKRPYGGV